MGMFILSAVGLPFLAIVFFSILESAFSSKGLWIVLAETGMDLCRISIGIAGAVFLDFQVRSAPGTWAATVLLLELIISASAMLVKNRANEMGITQPSARAFSILGLGIVAMVVPAVFIVLNGIQVPNAVPVPNGAH
jgi:hypothetical protein